MKEIIITINSIEKNSKTLNTSTDLTGEAIGSKTII